MSNPDPHPDSQQCSTRLDGPAFEVIGPRAVPLGGPRSMSVRRTLPSRQRSLIGAWCFIDHYGPDEVASTGGMTVTPHPHTGLATVSWLFAGEIEHRDSLGTEAMVRPGEVNLMTAGRGISHQEISTTDTSTLHGVQLWVALPDAERHCAPDFEHYAPELLAAETGVQARVFLGHLLDQRSPVRTATPLLGAELVFEPDAAIELDLDPSFEHGVLVDHGDLSVEVGKAPHSRRTHFLRTAELGYLAPTESPLRLSAGSAGARILLLGGEPLGEQILMWWNFVGRSHEEISAYREEWQRQIVGGVQTDGLFGVVSDHRPIPAPAMPTTRLKARNR